MFVTAGADNFNSFGAWPNFLTVLYRADILKMRKNAINTADNDEGRSIKSLFLYTFVNITVSSSSLSESVMSLDSLLVSRSV